jgi:tetratricopeptide (TPR) repeat protein
MSESELRADIFRRISDDPAQALILAQQNLEKHPTSMEALLILADLYFLGLGPGREAARPLYEEILRFDSNNLSALTGLALMPRVGAEASIELLKRAALTAGTKLTFMNLGYRQWEYGRYADAGETFRKILRIALDEQNPEFASSVEGIIDRLRRHQPPIHYSYALPD